MFTVRTGTTRSARFAHLHRLLAALALSVWLTGCDSASIAPSLQADWYWRDSALDAWGLLFAANAMIFVLSEYTCRMKADPVPRRVRRSRPSFSFPRRISDTRQQTH